MAKKTVLEALVCPSCGGDVDLDDEQVFGYCKYCGTRVQNSNYKRVEIKGKVKVDNSEVIENHLLNARRAREKEDWNEVERYYNLVEQYEPQNIEAIFYSSYGRLRSTLLENYSKKWDNDFLVLQKSISVLDDYFDINKEQEEKRVIIDACNDILKIVDNRIIVGNIVRYGSDSSYQVSGSYKAVGFARNLFFPLTETLNNIALKYQGTDKDPKYLYNLINGISKQKVSTGGCYVATAVYGSYDCPEVWTLRRFRDNKLAKSWYGRLFIHAYYFISPTIVKLFGKNNWFKNIWKPKLDKLVNKLRNEGYESTPYDDKNW